MSADMFMLELFSKDARAHCATMSSNIFSGGEFSPEECRAAAASLKADAKMLGFEVFAGACQALENAFATGGGRPSEDSAAARVVKILSDCADAPLLELEQKIESSSSALSSVLEEGVSLPPQEHSAAPQNLREQDSAPDSEGKSALDADDSMAAMFLDETRAQLANMGQLLIDIEDDFKNPQKLERLMRACHSMKGAARVVGLSDIVDLTHKMEDCFVAAQNSEMELDSDSLDVILDCVDFIYSLCEIKFSKIDKAKLKECMDALGALASGAGPASTVGPEESASGGAVLDARSPVSDSNSHEDSIQSPQLSVSQLSGAGRRNGAARDSAVKVSAKNLRALMELAAESLVENAKIEIFRENLSELKTSQQRLAGVLEQALCLLEGVRGAESSMERIESVRRGMESTLADLRAQIGEIGEYSRRSAQLSSRLYSEVLASKMRPLAEGVQMFPRMVRDLAKSAGKKIILEIDGRDVPVDRDVLDKLESPLTQILRNACDHGIESPDERAALGKPAKGRISIKAWHAAGFLMLKVSDDGVGMDIGKIREKILQKKLATPEMLENMSGQEIMAFLFLPGFTTKENVSKLSGRGVGLDIVHTMLQEVGGTIEVESEVGVGTSFTMRLPITRSVMKSLGASIDGQLYAFPLSKVSATAIVRRDEISFEGGRRYFLHSNRKVALVDAARALGFEKLRTDSDFSYVVVVAGAHESFGFEVDDMPFEVDLVVRPLHPLLGKVQCVSATSIAEDGAPVLILDIDDIILSAKKVLESSESVDNATGVSEKSAAKKILVVDDSATVRETQRKILQQAGFAVELASDGVDGWNCVRLNHYDLIVSDIDMPRMNGFELVKKIRARDKLVPIIMVSYKDRREDGERSLEVGANMHLTKSSFSDDTFIDCVKKFLNPS